MNKILVFWRTMIVILILAGLLAWGLWLCLDKGPNGVALFPVYCTAVGALGALAVGKSAWEHWTNARNGAKTPAAPAPPLTEAPKEAPHA